MVTAAICTIGDEILIGQIIDTNSSKIAQALNNIGVKVNTMISTSDKKEEIISTLTNCLINNHIVIVTGGLGPTKDDITKKTLAELCKSSSMVVNLDQLAIIKDITSARGIDLNDLNKDQALVPNNCKVILNYRGTAPCMEFELTEFGKENLIFSLPGVPFEMEDALPRVLESIQNKYKLDSIFHKTICTFGIPESMLAKKIEDWENNLPQNIKLAYLPNPILGVRLRLSIYDTSIDYANEQANLQINKLERIIPDAIYGSGENSLQQAIGEILRSKAATLSVVESCTGGFLSSLLTSVPGSSEYYYGGIVSYDNSIKKNIIGVKEDTLIKFGAVSKECVIEMAEGIRNVMKTTYSISTSGIAGPGGATETKPVGLVWIAVSGPKGTQTFKYNFKGYRELNIQRFASNALNSLRLSLINNLI